MNQERRDWSEIESPHGSAGEVPQLLLQASEANDPEDAYFFVMDAVRHAADEGGLEPSALQLADDLLDAIESKSRNTWSFLHGLVRLLLPGAHRRGDPRATPVDSIAPFPGAWVYDRGWESRVAQAALQQEVVNRIRLRSKCILAQRRPNNDEAFCAAAAVAALVGLEEPAEWLSLGTGLKSDLAQISVVGSTVWKTPTPASLESVRAAAEQLAPPARELLHLLIDAPDVDTEVLRSWLRRPASDLSDVFELVWMGGSVAFLFAAALARTSRRDAGELLEQVVVEADDDSQGQEQDTSGIWMGLWSPPAASAYWLMRRTLARHWMKGEALGAEDLSGDEVSVLHMLSRRDRWRRGAGATPQEFGVFALRRNIGRLSGAVRDTLNEVHEGFFGAVWVRWSRWKWIMNALARTEQLNVQLRKGILDGVANELILAAAPEERDRLSSAIHALREQPATLEDSRL